MKGMLKTSNKRMIFHVFIVTLLVLLFGLFWQNKDKKEAEMIKNDYEKITGYFVSYYELADSGRPYIEYCYFVNRKKYYRTIHTSSKYSYCENSVKCNDKEFWVIYSTKHPEKSLIDLTKEIQGLQKPIFPRTLDNFK